ncbi:MAG: phage major tail protein, TP901-1 family [Ruminococcus sp.]|nr:phage major tail protein, TP901-1 family [Ruminococcus sp.]
MKFDLQLFSVIQGKRIVYLYRRLKDATLVDAMAIAFTTENSTSKSRDSDTVSTKSGTIRVPQDTEVEISTTALFASENDEIVRKIESALDDGELMEIWEVNLDKKGTEADAEKFFAKYYQGYVSSFELSSNSEDHVEASLEFAINGKGVDGYATVTEEQQELADYIFKNTTKETEGTEG